MILIIVIALTININKIFAYLLHFRFIILKIFVIKINDLKDNNNNNFFLYCYS